MLDKEIRLYLWVIMRVNEGGMVGMNIKVKEYQRKIGKRISVIKNTYSAKNLAVRW